MVFDRVFESHGFEQIIAYSGKDITDSMIESCFEIDRDFYDESYYWDREETKNIVKEFGQFCFVIYDKRERKIIGYSFWFPIKTEVFNDFIKGKKTLLILKTSYCSNFKNSKYVNLFCGGEAFILGYNLIELHKVLEDMFQKRILDLALIGTKVKYIAMEACCKYDEEFFKDKLGLTKSVKKDNSTFYYDEYSPSKIYKESRYVRELKQYYK